MVSGTSGSARLEAGGSTLELLKTERWLRSSTRKQPATKRSITLETRVSTDRLSTKRATPFLVRPTSPFQRLRPTPRMMMPKTTLIRIQETKMKTKTTTS